MKVAFKFVPTAAVENPVQFYMDRVRINSTECTARGWEVSSAPCAGGVMYYVDIPLVALRAAKRVSWNRMHGTAYPGYGGRRAAMELRRMFGAVPPEEFVGTDHPAKVGDPLKGGHFTYRLRAFPNAFRKWVNSGRAGVRDTCASFGWPQP